jgi:hypothetical protein
MDLRLCSTLGCFVPYNLLVYIDSNPRIYGYVGRIVVWKFRRLVAISLN